MAITVGQQTQILKIVVGLFNAAPGATYLTDLANFISAGGTMQNLAQALAATTVFTGTLAGRVTQPAIVTQLMSNFGLTYNTGTLAAAGVNASDDTQTWLNAQVVANTNYGDIIYTATTLLNDTAWVAAHPRFQSIADTLTNKAAVAAYYSATLAISSTSLTALQAVVSAVTATTFSVTAGVTATSATTLAAAVIAGGGSTGATFSLTTGVDHIIGSTNNDTISSLHAATALAATDTLSVTDIIDGGAGADTLTIVSSATNTDVTDGALISNVEIVNIRNVAATTVVSSYAAGAGVTTVNSYLSTGDVTITKMANGATVGYIGNGNLVNGALSATYVTGATGAATLNISGGTITNGGTTGDITIIAAGTNATVINSTGAANQIGAITNAASSESITINATTGLSTGAWNTGTDKTLTVTGVASTGVGLSVANDGVDAAVTLGALTAGIATIDASAMTAGGLCVTLIAAVSSFNGGQGSDKVTTAALTSTTEAIIDAGAGTDTLVVAATAHVATAAKAKLYANFEKMDFVSGQTGNMSLFTNSIITGVMFGGNTAGAINLTAAQAGNITVYATETTPTFGVKDAAVISNLDTLKLTFDNGLTAKSTISMGAFTATGVETINIVANDHVTMTSLLNATALTNMIVTGDGNVSITTAALVTNPNTVIDASTVTGTVSLIATAATTNGLALKGSLTNANILTGSARADTITGGSGNDTITGAVGANIMTGGGGADSFVVVATGVLPSESSFQTITDFSKTAGTTTFDTISAVALTLGAQTAAAGSGVATLTAGVATFNSADTTFAQHLAAVAAAQDHTPGAATIWQGGSDSYIYISDGILSVSAADTLVKLTGVTAGALTIAGNAITAIA